MRIGIGSPMMFPGVDRASIIDWARAAEGAGFSSVAAVDRLVHLNFEPLMALSATAAVTERVELLTHIVLAPLHANAAMLAKQAATLDHLSQGRVVLGLGVGGNPDDFEISGVDYSARGRAFDHQLTRLRTLWQGEPVGPISGEAVGPGPYQGRRLPILIGGHSDPAFRRAAEHGDGWASADPPKRFVDGAAKMRAAWAAAGRDGAPRLIASVYFALGEAALHDADDNLSRYYNATDDRYRSSVLRHVARDADAVRRTIAAFEEAGADDVICLPASTDLGELERLAQIAL